jgi:hypothetical protein
MKQGFDEETILLMHHPLWFKSATSGFCNLLVKVLVGKFFENLTFL